MATFTLGKPIETTTATITVDNKLTAGVHHFSLVVVDDSGTQSAAVVAAVSVSAINVPVRTP